MWKHDLYCSGSKFVRAGNNICFKIGKKNKDADDWFLGAHIHGKTLATQEGRNLILNMEPLLQGIGKYQIVYKQIGDNTLTEERIPQTGEEDKFVIHYERE